MAWGSKTQIATSVSVTSDTTEQYSSSVTLNPGELAHVEVEGDFPASPTDNLVVRVYATLDASSENWDDTPLLEFEIDNGTDPNKVSFVLSGLYKFRLAFVIKIKGFFRINIEENGRIVGDSGWCKNQVTNDGYLNYLVKSLAAMAGSKQVGFVALGTGGAPASNATTLPGEIMSSTQRGAVTATNVNSNTAQFTATFASSDSFLTAAANLSNIGLFAATTTNDTLLAGNTYASSSCNTNQNVNVTYQIRFS